MHLSCGLLVLALFFAINVNATLKSSPSTGQSTNLSSSQKDNLTDSLKNYFEKNSTKYSSMKKTYTGMKGDVKYMFVYLIQEAIKQYHHEGNEALPTKTDSSSSTFTADTEELSDSVASSNSSSSASICCIMKELLRSHNETLKRLIKPVLKATIKEYMKSLKVSEEKTM